MKQKLLLIFIGITYVSFSQKRLIKGTIRDNFSKVIPDCHIINFMTKKGVISDENGAFEIKVNSDDVLKITNIEFHSKLIRLKNIKKDTIEIILFPNSVMLDEVVIPDRMTGTLGIDFKKTPKDTIANLVNKFSNNLKGVDYSDLEIGEDERHLVKPISVAEQMFGGGGGGVAIGTPDKYSIEKRRKREEIRFKENFPKYLKRELGEDFFFKQLKIPPEKYYHFLEYCNPLGIEDLYKKNQVLEVINILKRESKFYLILIKVDK